MRPKKLTTAPLDRHFTIPLTEEQREAIRKAAAREQLPDALWARRLLVKLAQEANTGRKDP